MSDKSPDAPEDRHDWLEDIYGERSLAWVRERNTQTLTTLSQHPLYQSIEQELRDIHLSQDRIPQLTERGQYFYNFWQDATHKRGILRRVPCNLLHSTNAPWETILDIDRLALDENENWVLQGTQFLPPAFERCLVRLSRGGKDASVVREFNVETKEFVQDGFTLPEAKSRVSWLDQNRLLLAHDFGPASLTQSGYPRTLRIWERGKSPDQAIEIMAGQITDVSVGPIVWHEAGSTQSFIYRSPSFFSFKLYHLDAQSLEISPYEVPDTLQLECVHHNILYFSLRHNWQHAVGTFTAGSLVALDVHDYNAHKPRLIWQPTSQSALLSVFSNSDTLFAIIQENVIGRLLMWDKSKEVFTSIDVPDFSTLSLMSASAFSSNILFHSQSFLSPPVVFSLDTKSDARPELQPLIKSPPRFDESRFQTQQYFAQSKDGTHVPYFVIHAKNIQYNGTTPLLLNAYGGFEVSRTPTYLGGTGKAWLERGGAYAVANIRGGGEYGPSWHQAALKENRQRAFDDFYAVAEDIKSRKISSTRRLGIQGGSNGGLLMGVAFTQRPDLAQAIICQVPLLDMLRFHKLLAGHSWTAEYGNPDDPTMRNTLRAYSPFHNLKAGLKYPKIFFVGSTADDRVHPGHARKMAARLEELGHRYYYYENIEGGHSAAANIEQLIKRQSLEFCYLLHELVDFNL